ncbi:ubiquinol-cytochrome-c reductase complex subunit-domain-containing protein [Leucosporidium creatinivorum]|uniref:Ubiquinol-cytochrome-c reductase complex subunit-domain-containing protein n=1 Tax=Leucosporidium creatinivorum TaxID=106004 RepID=A0A1Y2CJR8_9BASI|nr:ubiquinol-cytochrome-c reductase complex subunit-domain-containing protein [Leucosporidium creatinivorum]
MSSAPRFAPQIKANPSLAGFTVPRAARWVPTLALWGVAGVGALTLFASPIPLFQKDVLHLIPGVREYYTDNTPDSDKPF